jgi:hypothetical protein
MSIPVGRGGDMNKPHKHAELIKAWADGAEIEYYSVADDEWKPTPTTTPSWSENSVYRIKPEPTPDVVKYLGVDGWYHSQVSQAWYNTIGNSYQTWIKVTFDGATREPKSVELVK